MRRAGCPKLVYMYGSYELGIRCRWRSTACSLRCTRALVDSGSPLQAADDEHSRRGLRPQGGPARRNLEMSNRARLRGRSQIRPGWGRPTPGRRLDALPCTGQPQQSVRSLSGCAPPAIEGSPFAHPGPSAQSVLSQRYPRSGAHATWPPSPVRVSSLSAAAGSTRAGGVYSASTVYVVVSRTRRNGRVDACSSADSYRSSAQSRSS